MGDVAPLEAWKHAWRLGFAPQFSRAQLLALRDALAKDDDRLLQDATTEPPPVAFLLGWPVVRACAVGYCGWRGGHLETVQEVSDFFAAACARCDQLLGEPAGCRWFLNWFDETPREEMIAQLLPEVEAALEGVSP